jgi:molecular chaperone GrpE
MAKKNDHREGDSASLPKEQTPPDISDAAAGSPTVASPDAETRLKELEAETADLKDKLLRKQADFENFRKRMLRERDDAARYANAALLSDIIGIIDDFERAIASAKEAKDFAVFLTGVTMIEKQLVELLETRWGLRRFTSVGEVFDPNKHEAVLRVEGPADSVPTVVEDYQKGYFLHERVLRAAKVKVKVPASTAESSGADSLGSDGGTPQMGPGPQAGSR